MNKLNKEKQTQIISALVEGNSLRATARMCDVAFNTVLKLLPQIGEACAEYQDMAFRNLNRPRLDYRRNNWIAAKKGSKCGIEFGVKSK